MIQQHRFLKFLPDDTFGFISFNRSRTFLSDCAKWDFVKMRS
jgi:hypothetical protein